jgi:hypothetical protein
MKTKSLLCITVSLAVLITLSSCKTSQLVKKQEVSDNSSDEIELITPFSGPEYKSNTDFFREKAAGVSKYNIEIANKQAVLEADGKISNDIEQLIKNVSEDVTNALQINDKMEISVELSQRVISVSKQYIKGTRTIAEKAFKSKKDGTITYWVVRELSLKPLVDEIANTISKDQKVKQAITKEEIRKMANDELDKMEKDKMTQEQKK